MPVGGQARAGHHAAADQRQRAVDMGPERGHLAAMEGHGLVQQRRVAAGDEVLRQAQQRPEHDVAMRVAGADAGLALEEHEPLRPVAVRVLRGEGAQQQVAHRCRAAQRQQHLQRALADVAGAPAAAGVLLQAPRRQVVHQRVVGIPGQDVAQLSQRRLRQLPLRQRQRLRRHGLGLQQRTAQRQRERRGGGKVQAQHRLAAAGAIVVEPPVVARDRQARGLDDQRAVRKACRQLTARRRRDAQLVAAVRPGRLQRRRAVIAAQRQVQAGAQRQRLALQHLQRQRHAVRRLTGRRDDLDQPAVMRIQPAAALRLHLEGRGQPQQLPAALRRRHEQAQPRRAEQAQQAALGGQQAVDADVALGQHRVEDAAHPAGGRQRGLVGHQVLAGAQDVAVRALHQQLLGAQHHMAGAIAGAGEEAQQPAVLPFLVAALAGEQPPARLGIEVMAGQLRRGGEQAGRRHMAGGVQRRSRPRLGQRQQRRQAGQIGHATGLGMMGLQAEEEAGLDGGPGRQPQRLVLQRHQRMLLLQALPRQAGRQRGRRPALAGRMAPHLRGVGRKALRAPQRAGQQPGVQAALRLVLARRQQHAVRGVVQRLQVEVVADVELVGARRAVVAQAHVLHQHGRHLAAGAAGVVDLQVPEQRRLLRGQAQLQAQRQAVPRAAHLERAIGPVHAERRQRPQQRCSAPRVARVAPTQPDVGRPTFQLVAGKQVEHQPGRQQQPAQRAVGQQLGFEAGLVADQVRLHGQVWRWDSSQGSRPGSL